MAEPPAPNMMGIKNIHMKIGSNTVSKKHPAVEKLKLDILDSNFNMMDSDEEEPMINTNGEVDKDGNQTGRIDHFAGTIGGSNVTFRDALLNTDPIGGLVGGNSTYHGKLIKNEYPETALDSNDFQKRLRFDGLQNLRREEMCNWKQKDIKGIKKNIYIKEVMKKNEKILSVSEKNDLEKLEVYKDRFPLLETRKSLNKLRILIQMVAFQI